MVFVSLFLIEESNLTKEEEKKLSGTRKRKLRDGLMFDGRKRKKEKKKKKKKENKEFCSERSLLFCYGTFNSESFGF